MNRKFYLRIGHLVLAAIFVFWGASQAGAQKQVGPAKQGAAPTTITDAAGRVHVRNVRPPYAQRRAAAKARVKAMREAAAKKKMSEVKK